MTTLQEQIKLTDGRTVYLFNQFRIVSPDTNPEVDSDKEYKLFVGSYIQGYVPQDEVNRLLGKKD